MPAEKSLAQAIKLIQERYADAVNGIVSIRLKLEISSSGNFKIFQVNDDGDEYKIESGSGTVLNRQGFTPGNHFFRLDSTGQFLREKLFRPAMEDFFQKVRDNIQPYAVIIVDFERNDYVFTISAHCREGHLDNISFAIHPMDKKIPAFSLKPFCISKPHGNK